MFSIALWLLIQYCHVDNPLPPLPVCQYSLDGFGEFLDYVALLRVIGGSGVKSHFRMSEPLQYLGLKILQIAASAAVVRVYYGSLDTT